MTKEYITAEQLAQLDTEAVRSMRELSLRSDKIIGQFLEQNSEGFTQTINTLGCHVSDVVEKANSGDKYAAIEAIVTAQFVLGNCSPDIASLILIASYTKLVDFLLEDSIAKKQGY